MFVFDILVYVFFAWLMYAYAKNSYVFAKRMGRFEQPDKNLWIFWLFFAFICGIRWNVGVDSVGYMQNFAEGRINDEKGEYIWQEIVLLISKLQLHYTVGMGLVAFLQLYFLTKLPSRYRYILVFMPIALFGGCYFLDYCNGMRQMLAASIFVYGTQFIIKKKPIHYLVLIFITSYIHHSVVMMYPMILLAYIRPDKISFSDKRLICTIIFIICFIAGQTPQFTGFLSYFNFLVENMDDSYSYVDNVIERTIVEGDNDARSFGPMQLSYFLTSLATIWYGKDLKTIYKDKIPYFDLWWLFSFVFGCGYFLVCNVNFMFIRPFQYFEPFQLIIVSLLLFYFYSMQKKKLFWILTIIIWAGLSWNIMKSVGVFGESVTYKMFFFHDLYERIHV